MRSAMHLSLAAACQSSEESAAARGWCIALRIHAPYRIMSPATGPRKMDAAWAEDRFQIRFRQCLRIDLELVVGFQLDPLAGAVANVQKHGATSGRAP